jgi:hypothetical protein
MPSTIILQIIAAYCGDKIIVIFAFEVQARYKRFIICVKIIFSRF